MKFFKFFFPFQNFFQKNFLKCRNFLKFIFIVKKNRKIFSERIFSRNWDENMKTSIQPLFPEIWQYRSFKFLHFSAR